MGRGCTKKLTLEGLGVFSRGLKCTAVSSSQSRERLLCRGAQLDQNSTIAYLSLTPYPSKTEIAHRQSDLRVLPSEMIYRIYILSSTKPDTTLHSHSLHRSLCSTFTLMLPSQTPPPSPDLPFDPVQPSDRLRTPSTAMSNLPLFPSLFLPPFALRSVACSDRTFRTRLSAYHTSFGIPYLLLSLHGHSNPLLSQITPSLSLQAPYLNEPNRGPSPPSPSRLHIAHCPASNRA